MNSNVSLKHINKRTQKGFRILRYNQDKAESTLITVIMHSVINKYELVHLW
jgi:hypothetical protein